MAKILIIFMRINWLNFPKIPPIIERMSCALVQKMSTPKKSGGQNTGCPLHFKK